MTIVADGSTAGERAQEAVERALAAAIRDSRLIGYLLDELSRGRLWLPLPDDGRPVTDGSAVTLPTVTYLGSVFVPAFTSAARLHGSVPRPRTSAGPGAAAGPGAGAFSRAGTVLGEPGPAMQALAVGGATLVTPHIVVPAAALARRLPPDVGIALNPGAGESVPVYPEGVAYLAAACSADRNSRIRVGPPPIQPDALLTRICAGLLGVPQAIEASAAWLNVEAVGEGLVIAATLEDPTDAAAQDAVIRVVEQAAQTAPVDPWFPIDVTFPGEGVPDLIDEFVSRSAVPFYSRD